MFSNFTSETHRVVSDVYNKDSEDTYSYILTYLYSKTTRIYKTIGAISDKSVKELRRGEFKISRRLLLMILENFKFMFYTFDCAFLKLMINCLEWVGEETLADYKDVFENYFAVVVDKPYKNEKHYKDLFIGLCAKDFKFDACALIKYTLKLKELFIFDYEIKFKRFNEYLYRCDVDRTELIVLMLENCNLVNSTSMLNTLVFYAAKNRYSVIALLVQNVENKFLILKSCNLVLEGFFNMIPLGSRDEESFNKKNFFYAEISMVVTWGVEVVGLTEKDEQLEDEVKSFLNLFKTYYSVQENRVIESQITVPYLLVDYFKVFLSATSSSAYRLILKKVFQSDFITSTELTIYSRSFQRFMLQMLREDAKRFHDKKFFILLGEIFNTVECFRETVIAMFTHFIDHIFGRDESFDKAFEARLRIMYFVSKNASLQRFLEDLIAKRPSERTRHLLEDQKRKMGGEYVDEDFDITSDMVTYENYVGTSVGKYGRSLKSSINLDKVALNRNSKLNMFKDKK